jgi:hypothetical protein
VPVQSDFSGFVADDLMEDLFRILGYSNDQSLSKCDLDYSLFRLSILWGNITRSSLPNSSGQALLEADRRVIVELVLGRRPVLIGATETCSRSRANIFGHAIEFVGRREIAG